MRKYLLLFACVLIGAATLPVVPGLSDDADPVGQSGHVTVQIDVPRTYDSSLPVCPVNQYSCQHLVVSACLTEGVRLYGTLLGAMNQAISYHFDGNDCHGTCEFSGTVTIANGGECEQP